MTTPHEDTGALRADLAASNPIRRENAAALAPTSYPSAAELRSRPTGVDTHSAPVTSVGNKRRIAWVAAAAVVALGVGGVLVNQYGLQRNQVAVEPSPTPSPETPTNTSDKLPLTDARQTLTIAGQEITLRELAVPPGGFIGVDHAEIAGGWHYASFYPGVGGDGGYTFHVAERYDTADLEMPASAVVNRVRGFKQGALSKQRGNSFERQWWEKYDPETTDIQSLKNLHRERATAKGNSPTSRAFVASFLFDAKRPDLSISERAAILTVLARVPEVSTTWEKNDDGRNTLVLTNTLDDENGKPKSVRLDGSTGLVADSREVQTRVFDSLPPAYLKAFNDMKAQGKCLETPIMTMCSAAGAPIQD